MEEEDPLVKSLVEPVVGELSNLGDTITALIDGLTEPFANAARDLSDLLRTTRLQDKDRATQIENLSEGINNIIQAPYLYIRDILEEVPIFKGIYKGADTVDEKYYDRPERACDVNNEMSIEIPNIFGKPEKTLCVSFDAVKKALDNPDKATDSALGCVGTIIAEDAVEKVKDAINPYTKLGKYKVEELLFEGLNAFTESATNVVLALNYLGDPLEILNQYVGCTEGKILS